MSGVSATASAAQQAAASIPISNDMLTVPGQDIVQAPPRSNATTTQASGAVDEAEWAAFEAEMSTVDAAEPTVNGTSTLYIDATISAPALTAAQLAAKSQEEENERRKHAAEVEIADEREDATRALETEFEEMEELESRVRRLKERREELRKESIMNLRDAALPKAGARGAAGKENARSTDSAVQGEALDEDDEDEDEDDWDGFRFTA
jgi:zinc finger protein 830